MIQIMIVLYMLSICDTFFFTFIANTPIHVFLATRTLSKKSLVFFFYVVFLQGTGYLNCDFPGRENLKGKSKHKKIKVR